VSQEALWYSPPEPPKKKKRKLHKDERLIIEEAPWTVRYLHWALLVALIPLLISFARGDKQTLDVEDQIQKTIEQLPDQARERVELVRDDTDDPDVVIRALPGQKLAGALFARKTWAHWIFAFFSGTGFLLFFVVLCQRDTAQPMHLVYVALFT